MGIDGDGELQRGQSGQSDGEGLRIDTVCARVGREERHTVCARVGREERHEYGASEG